VGRICRKRRFKSGGMKERVGDENVIIIISVTVRGINDQIRFYRVAQNKIPHWRICNISATGGLILKIL